MTRVLKFPKILLLLNLLFLVFGCKKSVISATEIISASTKTALISLDITDLPPEILSANPDISNAVANDNLSDDQAIQAAIDWLTARQEEGLASSAIIYIPEGIFHLEKAINVNSPDITFKGAGLNLTTLKNADAFRVGTNGLPDSGVDINSIDRGAYLFNLDEDARRVVFSSMALTGPEIHGAIFALRSDGLEISEVKFSDFVWSSVRLFNLSNVKIYNNQFVNAGGQAQTTKGVTGGAVYATFLSNAEIYNNSIVKSSDREGNVYGIKGRKFTDTRIHHNTIKTNFAIELPFENDRFVEIDHNFLGGTVSMPKSSGGAVPDNGFTFHIHHNYFTTSYALEWARNGVEVNHNVFVFDTEQDNGNLISSFGSESASGSTKFHNNLILNPGRGIFWGQGAYNNFSFHNNEVIANETITPRLDGLFGFNQTTDFRTIQIKDNIITVNGISRPLMRSQASYGAIIENNILTNVADVDQLRNSSTDAAQGLLEPLYFQVGANGEYTIDGFDLQSTENSNKKGD